MNLKLTKKQNAELIQALLSVDTDEDRVQVYYDYGQSDYARELQLQIRSRIVIGEIGPEAIFPANYRFKGKAVVLDLNALKARLP